MKGKASFHIYAFIAVAFWSLAYVLTRMTLQYFSAFSIGFLRYFVASCALAIVAVSTKMPRPRAADLPLLALSGAFGFFLYMIAFNKGQATVSAATASVVVATSPPITALLARIVDGEALRRSQWAAIAVSFAGVAVLALMHGVFSVNAGLLWLLLAAFVLSVYNLLQRRLTKTYTALQATTHSIFLATLMFAVFLPGSIREAARAPAVQLFYVGLMGIFSSAAAYVAWTKAFALAPKASQVSNYMFVTPFLTSLLGFLIVREVPDAATLAGGSLILLGLLLFNFGGDVEALLRRRKHRS